LTNDINTHIIAVKENYMARRKQIYHPSQSVTITGATTWQESHSNPGSYYRELFVQMQGQEIGRQFVDESMENYESGAWDLIVAALDEGYHIEGRGCILIGAGGELYMDSDHFEATRVYMPADRQLFEWTT